jgi:hypothetical protein
MTQPSSVIKLVEPGRHSVDAKSGAQGRYRTAKFLRHFREKAASICMSEFTTANDHPVFC